MQFRIKLCLIFCLLLISIAVAERYEFNNGTANGVEIIKVHFKNSFRGPDQDLATIDQLWQLSDVDSSQVIINNSEEFVVTSGTPIILEEGYELAIKSIDIDGNKVYAVLSKNGKVVETKIVCPQQTVDGFYTYLKDTGSADDLELIKVHFKNSLRSADYDIATIDQLWQISDNDSSKVIVNNSDELVITSGGTPLMLEEGYVLAVKSIDIDGNKAYVELFKNGEVIDSKIVIPPQIENSLYVYSTDLGSFENIELIKVHFRSSFRGADEDLATIDRIWQASEADPYQVIINHSDQILLKSGTSMVLEEGYELAIKSIDIDGNNVYIELYKDGNCVNGKIIVVPQTEDDSYIYMTHPEAPANTLISFYD